MPRSLVWAETRLASLKSAAAVATLWDSVVRPSKADGAIAAVKGMAANAADADVAAADSGVDGTANVLQARSAQRDRAHQAWDLKPQVAGLSP